MAGKRGKSGTHGHATGPTRTKAQREINKIEMVDLMRRGWTRSKIAQEFGVHRTQIAHDWKQVLADMYGNREDEVNQLVTLKLEEIGEIKREAWGAWERSKKDKTKQVVEDWTSDSGSGSTKIVDTKEGNNGEARYLDMVLKCISAERELLGLDPKKGIQVSGTIINWDSLVSTVQVSVETGTVPDLIEQQIQSLMNEGPSGASPEVVVIEGVVEATQPTV